MPNWGLIDNATANAPMDVLASILAEQKAKQDAAFKMQGELLDRKVKLGELGVKERGVGVQEANQGLQRDEFNDKLGVRQKSDQEFNDMLNEAQAKMPWMVPVLKAQRVGVKIDAKDAALSPEAQRQQQIQDTAAAEAAKLKGQITLKQTPEYSDLHPKPTVGDYNPFTDAGPSVFPTPKPQPFNMNSLRPVGAGNGPAPVSSHGTSAATVDQPVKAQGPTDEAFLASLPPSIASRVKALADGRYPIPTGRALADPALKRDLDLARRYDPSFDAINYGNRVKTQSDFTTGPDARTVTNLNSVIGHIAGLDKAVEGLRNFDALPGPLNQGVNYIKNEWLRGGASKDPEIKSFEENANLAASELSRAYTGSEGSLADREKARSAFGVNDSQSSNKAAIKKALELLTSKMKATDEQYQRGMGGNRFKIADLLSPESRSAYDELMKKYGGSESSDLPPASHFAGQAPGPYDVPKAGGGSVRVIWDGTNVRGGD